MDWRAHYNAIYSSLAVNASLTLASTGSVYSPTVIDKTAGVSFLNAGVETVKPACVVRQYELEDAGVSLPDLEGSYIEFSGKTWRIDARLPKPSPTGEADGELYLFLTHNSNL